MMRTYKRGRWAWLYELIRGQSKADADYRKIMGTTLALARADISDEEARQRLREVARASIVGARGALEDLEKREDGDVQNSYLGDRAVRLLEAAMNGRAVDPPDPARRDEFRAEEELGRLPLEVAFERLAQMVPELNGWRSAVVEERVEMHVLEMKRLAKVIGPEATTSITLARSQIAIAIAYLSALVVGREDLHAAYFERTTHPSAIVVFDRRRTSS